MSASNAVRKILVPIDIAEGSGEPTIAMASMMARKLGASIELIYIWQPPPLFPVPIVVIPSSVEAQPANMEELARTRAGAQLMEIVTRLRKEGVSEVHCRVGIGSPAHEIVDLAELGHFDLIVMGTHGRKGVSHAVLGSVAEKVVRRAKCAVLTVRTPH
jgi:nucleotide-binding universal stress UspA family protein